MCERTSRFTIRSGFIKRWTIKRQRRSIRADKTSFLEWVCFVLFSTKNCIDFWDHHKFPRVPSGLFTLLYVKGGFVHVSHPAAVLSVAAAFFVLPLAFRHALQKVLVLLEAASSCSNLFLAVRHYIPAQ